MSKRQTQKEQENQMLLRHHELTQELECKQLTMLQRLRDEHMRKQHQTELANQQEYTARAQRELKHKHAIEVKQMPKSLKVEACLSRSLFT